MELALEICNLEKSYGDFKAVDDISFTVNKGALFAFLGVNGAGKSTTINMICSILKKDAGRIVVSGYDLDKEPFKVKRETGVVFQTSVLDRELSVKQNLEIRTAFYSLSKEEKRENVQNIIKLLELEGILNRPVKHLSGGQMRRVDIARAMVHSPRLLILDEPTTGLDPKTRLAVWSLIDDIRKTTGMTVFLTTHYLEEAEKATDVVVMDKGRIIAHGTPNELKNEYSTDKLLLYSPILPALEGRLKGEGVPFSYQEEREMYCISLKNTAEAKRILGAFGEYFEDFEIVKGNMDDVFLNVTGKNIAIDEEESD